MIITIHLNHIGIKRIIQLKFNILYKINRFYIIFKNPQTTRQLSPQVIYKYQTHRNVPWNDPQYQPLREYVDPIQQMTQRKYKQQKKGEPDTKYQTKRGFYMDYHIKTVKALPPPSHYKVVDQFDQSQNKKKSKFNKMDKSLSKYNYLDRIQMEQKNRKSPAPGSYNLEKTEKQIKQRLKQLKTRKMSVGNKRFFHEDVQHLSGTVPGMGSHNPHIDVKHVKPYKHDHKFWTQKHDKMIKTFHKKRLSEPDPGSYSPCPLSMTTFDRIQTADAIKRKKKDIKTTGFGTDAKFTYQRPNKKVIKEQRPDPISYETKIEWKGKNMDVRKNNWVRSRSTGLSASVYH